jgi:hypothetical protein
MLTILVVLVLLGGALFGIVYAAVKLAGHKR